ncbi:MAG TPA: alpha/beta hydrolase, partial [Gammaproteobacteria bacterium]|nr:alpha/beta hydrolase [Gammaproteobacteria bacterium]
ADLQPCAASAQEFKQFRWGELDELARTHADTVGREMPMELAAQIREVVSRGAGAQETSALYANQPRVYEPGEIEVVENLAYGPHERHRLDVHTDNYRYGDIPMPVVMYFHGGGFVRGNRAASRNVADYFASLGLVGVNATYRLAPEAQWPAGSEDVGAAVTWVKENISDHGGDPNQIFVIGKSAAAFHVAAYAFMPEILGPSAPVPAGVVLVSGTYGADSSNPSDGRVAYFGEDLSRWPEISVLGNIQRTDIPVLLSISDYDRSTTKASFVDLVRELTVDHEQMPRVVQLIGHDHYSPNPSIGTQDTQLSAEILQLIRSTAGTYQQMTAR